MKLKQIIRARDYIDESYTLLTNDVLIIKQFANKVASYFGNDSFTSKLMCYDGSFLLDPYTESSCLNDLELIRSFLQSMVDNVPNSSIIEKILDLRNEIINLNKNEYTLMLELLREIYSGFSNKIEFDSNIAKLASFPGTGSQARQYCALDINVLKGMQIKLETYADELLISQRAIRTNDSNSKVVINNTNLNTQTTNVAVDVDFEVSNALHNLEEASLSPQEEEKVKYLIDALQKLIESQETKSKKWNRFKEIVKGIADFSLQAAQILAPLMMAAWPK